jgi:hypothetical protein
MLIERAPHLAERVLRHRKRRGQFDFALEAKALLPQERRFLAAKSHRGLHLIARHRGELDAPLGSLRDAFGSERIEVQRLADAEPVVQTTIGLEMRYAAQVSRAIRARGANPGTEYAGAHYCVLRFDLPARRLFGLPAIIAELTSGRATIQLIVTAYSEFSSDRAVLPGMRPTSDVPERKDPIRAEDPLAGPRPSSEALLDAAVEYTFPASDPIAIQSAFDRAKKREAQ